ncbi:trehalose-6-phosphate synthase [Chloroflexota bacterium]
MWTRIDLVKLVKEKLADYQFIVVSNREPYIHSYDGRNVVCHLPAAGLTVALDPLMRACDGTWIAHGSGDADRETANSDGKIGVPPDNPAYTLKRIWLSKEEQEGYYLGFSNQALWPLCHIVYNRPIFKESDWYMYKKVNEIFANAVLEEIGDKKAFVFVQNYHFTLLPGLLKQANSDIITAQFWHIPWPNPEAFRVCPWQEEIVKGLLGNDLLSFHIHHHCNNFLETVDRTIEARIDRERFEVIHGGHRTAIRHFPISVDFERINQEAQSEEVKKEINNLKSRLGLQDETIGLGMDRIDYTKGIPDRLRAFDRFLQKYPRYRGKVVFIQAGVPSRTKIAAYLKLNEEIDSIISEINWKYEIRQWKPVIYLHEHLPPVTLMALRCMADFCVISPLHDGMNLVAKEFVASRFDEEGVLILSKFAGASKELSDAITVNPYATDQLATAFKTATDMPKSEKHRRMKKMREVVRDNNTYKWAADIISDLLKYESR